MPSNPKQIAGWAVVHKETGEIPYTCLGLAIHKYKESAKRSKSQLVSKHWVYNDLVIRPVYVCMDYYTDQENIAEW